MMDIVCAASTMRWRRWIDLALRLRRGLTSSMRFGSGPMYGIPRSRAAERWLTASS